MGETEVIVYRMNPAEDTVIFGDELEEGMWVLAGDTDHRRPFGMNEDNCLRAQRFRRVTRLRRKNGGNGTFIGEWADGYQEAQNYGANSSWIVKKNPPQERGASEPEAGT